MLEQFGGDLVLLDRLASGGMGEVYRAQQRGSAGFEKTVAVKRILPHFAASPEFNAMFQQEMKLCARLQHPNVAQVFRSGEHEGYLFLVMEFIDGKTIRQLIEKTRGRGIPIPVPIACFIVSEVAKGLFYAHTLRDDSGAPLQLVHRDVSPQNVMLGYRGEVKILDFGIAKAAGSLELTRPGDLKGNMAYVSPEAVEGLRLDGRSDIFSLGVVMYELLTQRKLFAGQSTLEIIRNVQFQEIPPLGTYLPQVPPEVERILAKALSRDRSVRYQSAEELHRELTLFLNYAYPGFVASDLGKFISGCFSEEIQKEETSRRTMSEALRSSGTHRTGVQPRAAASSSMTAPPTSARLDQSAETIAAPPPSGAMRRRLGWPFKVGSAFLVGLTLALAGLSLGGPAKAPVVLPTQLPLPLARFIPDRIAHQDRIGSWEFEGESKGAATQPDSDRQPVLAARPGSSTLFLKFDGTNDYLVANGVAELLHGTREASVVAVARARSQQKQTIWSIHYPNQDTDLLRIGFTNGGQVRLKASTATGKDYNDSGPVTIQDFAIYSTVVDKHRVTLYRNGEPLVWRNLETPLDFSNAGYFSIGQEYDKGIPGDYLNGELGEVLVWKRALSSSDRNLVERYLGGKYEIPVTANR